MTLNQIGTSTRYETVIDSMGIVAAGTGEVYLAGGERFGRLSVYAAGGVDLRSWSGSAWKPGT